MVGVFPAFPQARRKINVHDTKRVATMRLDHLTVHLSTPKTTSSGPGSSTLVFRNPVRLRGTAAYCLYLSSKAEFLAGKPTGIAAAKRYASKTGAKVEAADVGSEGAPAK